MNYFGLQRLTEPLQITFYVWALELVVLILFVACLPLFNLIFSFPQMQLHTTRITRQNEERQQI